MRRFLRSSCHVGVFALGLWATGCGGDDGGEGSDASGTDSETTGESDGDTGDDTGGAPDHVPGMGTAEEIGTFVAEMRYRGDGWTAQTEAPRPESSPVSPHDDVRVWINDIAIASQAAGNGGVDAPPHELYSAAVKEMYDGTDLVGVAVLYRTEEGESPDATTYWCYGPFGRCSTGDPEATPEEPIYGQGLTVGCGSCHGGNIFSEIP